MKVLVTLVLAIAVTSGCTRGFTAKRPYAAPSSAELVALLDARAASVKSLNARARATSWIENERVRATVLMLVERDGHLRLEAEVSLQGTVATLATDGRTFALLDAHKNEFSRGPACPANVASLIRIPLAPADVAAIILGDARRPPDATVSPDVAWDAERGADVLELTLPAQTLRVFFAHHGPLVDVVGAEALAGGRRLWRTSYDDFEGAGAARLPTTIRFAEGTSSYDDGVEIKLKDHQLGTPAPASAFTLTPPAGVTVRDVGCAGP
jgi:outer membrane lipoprotein-sorting protein